MGTYMSPTRRSREGTSKTRRVRPIPHRRRISFRSTRSHLKFGTLQTATLAFGAGATGATGGGPPFVATELARERIAAHTCDGRRSRTEQAAEFAHVDFSELESDEDALFHGAKEDEPTEFASERCFARAGELLGWLHKRPERRIAVVSRSVFLRSPRRGRGRS